MLFLIASGMKPKIQANGKAGVGQRKWMRTVDMHGNLEMIVTLKNRVAGAKGCDDSCAYRLGTKRSVPLLC